MSRDRQGGDRSSHEGAKLDLKAFLESVSLVDILIIVFLFGMFILGWAQGAVRRVVGILTMTFSFLLAVQLQVYLGSFLADHWYQYPREYSYMIGFLTVFAAAFIAFALVVQGTYKRVEILARHPIVDEILGGVLGVVQGLLFLVFITIALDTFYLAIPTPNANEIPFLRDIWVALAASGFGTELHRVVIPQLVGNLSFLFPETTRRLYVLP